MMVEVNTWVGFSTQGICDRTCWVLTMSESDWSWPCKAKNRTHAQRFLFSSGVNSLTDQLRASERVPKKKWKNAPQWFRNLLNESFLSIFVLVKGVCCFNQSRFLSLKSNTFPFVKSPICLADPVKGIAGSTPASGGSKAGPALWSFIFLEISVTSTTYLFKAIGKPWSGRLMR